MVARRHSPRRSYQPRYVIQHVIFETRSLTNIILGTVKMVRGQGMPSHRHHDFGNLFIQFDVKFPEKNWTTNPEHFEALKSILPPTVQPITPPIDVEAEQADLEDMDPQSQSRAAHGMGDDDDDMDGGPQNGERGKFRDCQTPLYNFEELGTDSYSAMRPIVSAFYSNRPKSKVRKRRHLKHQGYDFLRPRLYAFRKFRFAIWDRSSSWLATAVKKANIRRLSSGFRALARFPCHFHLHLHLS